MWSFPPSTPWFNINSLNLDIQNILAATGNDPQVNLEGVIYIRTKLCLGEVVLSAQNHLIEHTPWYGRCVSSQLMTNSGRIKGGRR